MRIKNGAEQWIRLVGAIALGVFLTSEARPQSRTKPAPAAETLKVLEYEGSVEVLRAGATTWDPVGTNHLLYVGDQLRTGERSRAVIQKSGLAAARVGEYSVIPVKSSNQGRGILHLLKGLLYFFDRSRPGDIEIETPLVSAVVRGTEFTVQVENDGTTTFRMLDGTVEMTNDFGSLTLSRGEAGLVKPGQPPVHTAVIEAINVIQWSLYYPGILDLDELGASALEKQALAESFAAYRSGDLLGAVTGYPLSRQPASAREKIYLASILLSVGQVERAEQLIKSVALAPDEDALPPPPVAIGNALRKVIAAVHTNTVPVQPAPELATEWMAESYYQQSRGHLPEALRAAERAVAKSPNFGLGWARVAEMEFSFGHTALALHALEKGLALAPRNAQAHALKGFLLSAQNKIPAAIAEFDQAIALDGALGNAWLGRGLCKIKQSHAAAGRADLMVAATLEPQRAILRSYLGKAYSNEGDTQRATKELDLAKKLDPNDPTGWFYSALQNQQNNRINEAVRDLERSQELNGNRSVYRSQLLLDQDRAVRSVNLATIYRDAGMFDVSVREAIRGVNADYGNYSAHLFLASSYAQLSDPNRINLRYETATESEYLVANVLAPAGSGTLSTTVSAQEYSRLFERDSLGLISDSIYSSRGDWQQTAIQRGVFGHASYSVGVIYRSLNGQRVNNRLEETQYSLQIRQEFSPSDTFYLQSFLDDQRSGDLIQYYDPASANPGLRIRERQEPITTIGYHHQWQPGVHTLILGNFLDDTFDVHNPAQVTFFLDRTSPVIGYVQPLFINQEYRSKIEIYSAEAQQIFQYAKGSTILGGRFQAGRFRTRNQQSNPSDLLIFFDPAMLPADQDVSARFERFGAYTYQQLQMCDSLLLAGGVSYDYVRYPENFRAGPVSTGLTTRNQISPKVGAIWAPGSNTTMRAAYTSSLSGASFDQSFTLEPSQVAGFNQAFRSLIPESVGGANAGARFETYGVSVEQKFFIGTYFGVSVELLKSKVDRTLGAFDFVNPLGFVQPGSLRERLDYRDRAILMTVNQLIGDQITVGARYRLSQAVLADQFPEVPDSSFVVGGFTNRQRLEAVLHQLDLYAVFNHPSGIFAELQGVWYAQSNMGYQPDIPGQSFWHVNTVLGYRFPQRKAEISVGLLNLTDQDYRLNPLTLFNEPPRERRLFARLRFNF